MIEKMDLELNLEGGDEIKMEALRKFLYKLNEVIDAVNAMPRWNFTGDAFTKLDINVDVETTLK